MTNYSFIREQITLAVCKLSLYTSAETFQLLLVPPKDDDSNEEDDGADEKNDTAAREHQHVCNVNQQCFDHFHIRGVTSLQVRGCAFIDITQKRSYWVKSC